VKVSVRIRNIVPRLASSAAKPTDAASASDSSDLKTTTTPHYQSVLTTIYSNRKCKCMSRKIRVLASVHDYILCLCASIARSRRRHDHPRPLLPTPVFNYEPTTADKVIPTGSIYALRSGSPPPFLAAVSARSGSTRMRSMKSPTPTPAKPSASSYPMASSSANKSPCTRVPVLGS